MRHNEKSLSAEGSLQVFVRYYKTPGTHKTEYYLSLSAPVEALEEMKPLV